MQLTTKIPEAIQECGFKEEQEFFFISKEKKKNVLKKATKGFVETVNDPKESETEYPVYVQLMSSFIFTGSFGMA